MKHDDTLSHGSFSSWGSGFRYYYEAQDCAVCVTPNDGHGELAYLRLGYRMAEDPVTYINTFNKTNQIKALMYSGNATTNLADTMDHARLKSLIHITGRISQLAYVLRRENFSRFSDLFCQDFDVKCLKIKLFTSRRQDTRFYMARLITHQDNLVTARSCTVSGLAAALSESILCDLLPLEFGFNRNHSAQNLLSAASKLATISRVLDQNFIPEEKLTHLQALADLNYTQPQ